MPASTWVADVTADTFQEQVVEQSKTRPVVVDFWAPWCGPCRQLGPALEALAAEKAGAFALAKVNTDDHPDLAQAFGVSGIPAVFAVRNGEVVDQFVGLLPPDQLRAFLDRLAPSEAETAAADALGLEGRDPAAAEFAYRQLFAADPNDPGARVGLARVLLARPGTEGEAAELLSLVDPGDHLAEAERLRAVLRVRDVPHADADLAAARAGAKPDDAESQYRLGRVLAARGDYLPAMDALLAAAEADRELGRTRVRELMVDVFQVIGPRSPEADDYRGRLRNLLY
ncbi:MAG: thioredoxin [Gemmataceae bacterium]|nr:thioredoxin [Gemmataceae bacterium]